MRAWLISIGGIVLFHIGVAFWNKLSEISEKLTRIENKGVKP